MITVTDAGINIPRIPRPRDFIKEFKALMNAFEQLEAFAKKNRGNPEALISYWRDGPGHDRINWGDEEGNLTRCHDLLSKYISSEDAWGFCQNRHIELFGESNATRDARLEGDK